MHAFWRRVFPGSNAYCISCFADACRWVNLLDLGHCHTAKLREGGASLMIVALDFSRHIAIPLILLYGIL